MISALDTNILLDLLIPQAPHQQAAKQLLDEAYRQGALIISEGVYAELSSQFDSPQELEDFLRGTGIRLERSTPTTLQQAGEVWRRYTRRRGSYFMDDAVRRALENDLVIDITTTGRKTGRPSRKEIWFHNVDGQLYITGSPGRRDWYANLVANPKFTFHLKRSTRADLPARATPILDKAKRREILQKIHQRFEGRRWNLDKWVEGSPLVQVEIMAL